MAITVQAVGDTFTATIEDAIANAINGMQAAWTAYGTPTTLLTAATTNPTLGNSTGPTGSYFATHTHTFGL